MGDVTQLLADLSAGDRQAAKDLFTAVYDELRGIAAAKMIHERPGQTLQATALVHEAYLRLVGPGGIEWKSRGHFFAAAAEAMRRILVDAARHKARLRHGGGMHRSELHNSDLIEMPASLDLIALDDALTRLADEDPVKAKLIKLRFFAGLSVEDAGRVLGISRATADRYWAYARAWLYAELHPVDRPTSDSPSATA